jgi:molybdate transport system substrate-binding protein
MVKPVIPLRQMVAVVAAITMLTVAGCGSDDTADDATDETTETTETTVDEGSTSETTTEETEDAEEEATSSTPESTLSGTLTVMAPGPFKTVMEQAKAEFEAAHPGVTVEANHAHIPALLTQLQEGVVADLIITPDAGTMERIAGNDLTDGEPVNVAKVPMALVVPADNPAAVADVSALADADNRVAVCADELPCGTTMTSQLEAAAAITIDADTLEAGGSPGIVTKAATGEIDVGLVLATDIAAGGDDVVGIDIPADINVTSDVTISVLAVSDDPEVAAAFIDFLNSEAGLSIMTDAGFLAP